jgi:hypothetical protein
MTSLRLKLWLLFGLSGFVICFFIFRIISNKAESLEGVDSDRDGIRDDVQAFIEKSYSDPKVRIVAGELHKSIQLMILKPETDYKRIIFAQQCLHFLYPDTSGKIGREIEAQTANTRARIKAYWKANARLSGSVISGAATNEEACSFNKTLIEKK